MLSKIKLAVVAMLAKPGLRHPKYNAKCSSHCLLHIIFIVTLTTISGCFDNDRYKHVCSIAHTIKMTL